MRCFVGRVKSGGAAAVSRYRTRLTEANGGSRRWAARARRTLVRRRGAPTFVPHSTTPSPRRGSSFGWRLLQCKAAAPHWQNT
ncbi:unnamed protein product [Arctia plantaginis]|uniref:Uncharacterized protein n=1 Tax=Arctia plantaginis TaxID=874455 RepID=A0A8S0Z031_ARCPL|nr:unnamed protein product [Arctia plantaginis]